MHIKTYREMVMLSFSLELTALLYHLLKDCQKEHMIYQKSVVCTH